MVGGVCLKDGLIKECRKSLGLEGSQSLISIDYFGNTRISVFPDVEQFLIMFNGFPRPVLLWSCRSLI